MRLEAIREIFALLAKISVIALQNLFYLKSARESEKISWNFLVKFGLLLVDLKISLKIMKIKIKLFINLMLIKFHLSFRSLKSCGIILLKRTRIYWPIIFLWLKLAAYFCSCLNSRKLEIKCKILVLEFFLFYLVYIIHRKDGLQYDF